MPPACVQRKASLREVPAELPYPITVEPSPLTP